MTRKTPTVLSPRDRWLFGLTWLVFLSLAAANFQWRHGWATAALVAALLAVVIPLLGWPFPSVLDGAYRVLSLMTRPIGWCVSKLVLALIFYAMITPIGWWMRWRRHDPLSLDGDSTKESYWEDRTSQSRVSDYFRQF